MRTVRNYRDEITLWSATSADDGFGKEVVKAPITFIGRWEEALQQHTTKTGETSASKAHVWFPEEISIQPDDWLFLGRSTATDPSTLTTAYQVMEITTVPDLRNLSTERVAIL